MWKCFVLSDQLFALQFLALLDPSIATECIAAMREPGVPVAAGSLQSHVRTFSVCCVVHLCGSNMMSFSSSSCVLCRC